MATAARIVPSTNATLNLRASLQMVEAGIPLDAITRFASSSGLSLTQICNVVIPARTLKHRRARKERLSLDESDKFARLVRIYDQTLDVFANTAKAIWWLNEPQNTLGGRTPLQAVRTEFGGRIVEEALIQIDEGMFP